MYQIVEKSLGLSTSVEESFERFLDPESGCERLPKLNQFFLVHMCNRQTDR